MSDVSVDIIKNRSGEAPDLPSGANLSGVSTAATLQVTNLNPTHINTSGVTTATTFSGSLKSTGTPTLGLGVTINSSGLNISGVATAGIVSATTLYGDGSNLTGVAMSIAPISYQPDVNDTLVTRASSGVSIGITFTERIIAGSGNVTLRIAGAAGTVVENFGVGSSVTISNNEVSVSPTAALLNDTVYHINYPSGSFTNTGGDVSYVGTAYTFTASPTQYTLWSWGYYGSGALGQNEGPGHYSSPIQIGTETNWRSVNRGGKYSASYSSLMTRQDGTLWMAGINHQGQLGQNNVIYYSSPVQIPGTTWTENCGATTSAWGVKTDGTLWMWGYNSNGGLGHNDRSQRSSPVQVGSGTDWAKNRSSMIDASRGICAIKTDGTLWSWGYNAKGSLGLNQASATNISSPTQVPGTTWSTITKGNASYATKTDGTLWAWGQNTDGELGQNDRTTCSSPVQIPGTTWGGACAISLESVVAFKTDGTLWGWGRNTSGQLAQNHLADRSSPVQIPGTWSTDYNDYNSNDQRDVNAIKADGTMWVWGQNQFGVLAQNNQTQYSSPVQIPGTWHQNGGFAYGKLGIKEV